MKPTKPSTKDAIMTKATARARRAKAAADKAEAVAVRIAGDEIHGRLLDRIDEIVARDLKDGPKTGVHAAFDAAAKRIYAAWEKGAEHDDRSLASLPRWYKPYHRVRPLMTPKSLVAEGRAMKHCAGSYAPYVKNGRSVLFSIALRIGPEVFRSTVELDRSTAEVRQHKGFGNKKPSYVCELALNAFLKRTGQELAWCGHDLWLDEERAAHRCARREARGKKTVGLSQSEEAA